MSPILQWKMNDQRNKTSRHLIYYSLSVLCLIQNVSTIWMVAHVSSPLYKPGADAAMEKSIKW